MLYRDAHLLCPACGLELERRTAVGRAFRGCHACNGLFVEHAVLNDMFQAMQPGAAPALIPVLLDGEGPRKRPCPACQKQMEPRRLEDVPVDECAAHGVWFDGSELPEVLLRTVRPEG